MEWKFYGRRRFLKRMVGFISGIGTTSLDPESSAAKDFASSKEALFYKALSEKNVQCLLCPRGCIIGDGKRGFCRNRENQKGRLLSVVYGKPCVVDIGPIEKAPLYHFSPGHSRLCLTCASCNLRCKYCQNWQLSQRRLEELSYHTYSPAEIIHQAKGHKLPSISFTYTEPTVYYEYLYDISVMARQNGIKTSIVSNGYINQEPLLRLLGVLDAVKIDLKGFSERFYEEICSATLEPVLQSLVAFKKAGVWLEIVNIVVPTLNDDPKMIEEMCRWIKGNLGVDTPIHFTRFFPNYKLTNLSPTPISTLEKAYRIAIQSGLQYVYIGNVPGHPRNSTFCPFCKQKVIDRAHFDILETNLTKGRCNFCNSTLAGKWA